MLLGSCIYQRTELTGGLLPFWLIIDLVKIPSEERLLKETFGEQYIQYQQHVPQLIPGLWLLKKSPTRSSRISLRGKPTLAR